MDSTKTQQADDRRGLPHASIWRRLELCNASWALEQEAHRLGQVAHKRSPEADRGDRIHARMAGAQVELDQAEETTAVFLRERAEEQVQRIFGTKDIPSITERRLWLDYDGKKALSGRFDVVYFTEKLALVIDYKTGWLEPDPADTNSQLKVLAVLIGIALPTVEEIVVQIVSGPYGVTEARYNLETLSQAYREIVATLRAIRNPNAAFSPSVEACHYCPAASICRAVKDIAPANPALAREQYDQLPDGEAAKSLLDGIEVLERRIEQIKAYYAERMEADPTYQVPGWNMVPGPQRRTVEDWKRAKARLEEFVPPADLEALANYSIPAVEKCVAKALKLKAKEAGAKLAEILGELLQVKPGNLCLKRVKGEAKLVSLEVG